MNFSSIKDGLLGNVESGPTNKDAVGVGSVPGGSRSGEGVASRKPDRLVGLDFAKGALVLLMVFYHWMNYFIGLDSPVYKYLRFLTPSFIFVTGFLISHVYFCRFAAGQSGIPARLIRRGVKLLGIVLFLNGVIRFLGSGIVATRLLGQSSSDLFWGYLTGSAPVAFSVLVPIAYLLILSAGLLIGSRHIRALIHLVSAVLVAVVLAGEWEGFQNGYLDLLCIGMLGISVGQIPIDSVHRIIRRPVVILIFYAAYLWAITVWNVVYALQVVGVCANVVVLYWLGSSVFKGQLLRVLARLGEYSLFAYIAQIVILQILRRGAHLLPPGMERASVALLVGVACTVLSVKTVDHVKRKSAVFNRLYTAVFS